jgi:hypothetical protein
LRSQDARSLFRTALADPYHRVVANALVGLYLLGETDVLNEMIELCSHKDHLFRAVMSYGDGLRERCSGDPHPSGVDPRYFTHRPSTRLKSILLLKSVKPAESESFPVEEPLAPEPVTPECVAAEAQIPPEKLLPEDAGSFNLFMFR